jgi:hypothetical protein
VLNENEREFQDQLTDAIELAAEENGQDVRVRSFRDEGVLTDNAGIVVTLEDGSEFQVTIVQSERAG